MEKICKEDDHEMDLPPGFRFHPTDEELITHYLYKKVFDVSFSARAIGDVDLNKSEPWELPCKVFQKSCGLLRIGSFGNDQLGPNCALPPLMDSSSPATTKYSAYVPCFSNPIPIDPLILSNNVFPLANSIIPSFPASVLRALIENNQGISNMSLPDKEIMNTNEISSFDDQEGPSTSAAGPVDLDCVEEMRTKASMPLRIVSWNKRRNVAAVVVGVVICLLMIVSCMMS
ncbi:hypothetical protein EZV62_024243 [Acer yangbiense]|uniref:NAC domain-containing protein n=1 Tax=Acer yangbiense TaxID=1000413 RepID=A0A5C7H4R0_9ROSI|nr:hypothetical protein EZV62_024243 [Acer yangbiense]